MAPAFVYATWAARFPELAATVPDSLAEQYAAEALLLPEGNRICNDPGLSAAQQTVLLNLATAHIAAINGAGSSPLVGRISNATEGSVSVAADYPTKSEAGAWWAQTKYGAQLWRMMGPYRTAQYIPGPASGAYGPGPGGPQIAVWGGGLGAGALGWGGYPFGWPNG